MDVFLSLPHLPFVSGIILVDEAKDDIEEDEASQKLVAGIQYAYSKPKVQRKVHVGLNCYIFYHLMQVGGGGGHSFRSWFIYKKFLGVTEYNF